MATLERGLSTAGKALNDGVTALLRALQPRTLYWLIVVAILGAFAARQIGYPITVGDTDM